MSRRRGGASGRALALALAGLLAAPAARAQDASGRPRIEVPRLDRRPALAEFLTLGPDGTVDTPLVRVSGFLQRTPSDGAPVSERTDVYLGYDARNLYCVFVCFDSDLQGIRANLSRRDSLGADDQIEIMLDTFADQRHAYAFVTNPLGVQWDSLWTEGQGFDPSWDTLWHTEGRLTDYGYAVLMAIPFKSLRFPRSPRQSWGFLLLREIQRKNEQTFYPEVTSRIEGRLNQAGTLTGLADISPGRNIQLIPYATARGFRVLEEEPEARLTRDREASAGLDARLVWRDSLGLDLTANPDYGQVESDAPQVTVNQRYEVYFPEKRPFFLENAGYFRSPIDLLFTRRIADPELGARLTGKLGAWALGALVMDDEAPGKSVPPDHPLSAKKAHIGVLRLSRDVSRQSSLGLLLTDRELAEAWSRVLAADGRVKLGQNWDLRFQGAFSSTGEQDGSGRTGFASDVQLNRSGRQFSTHIHYRDIEDSFHTDLGFVPRTDIRDLHLQTSYRLRPEGKRLISWGPFLHAAMVRDHQGTLLDWELAPGLDWELARRSGVEVFGSTRGERLRPVDFPGLAQERPFRPFSLGGAAWSDLTSWLSADLFLGGGRTINFVPPRGAEPALEPFLRLDARLTLRPTSRFQVQNTWLLSRLGERSAGAPIFRSQILRSRWSWQQDRRLSFRAILQYEDTAVDPELTSLDRRRGFNLDLLGTYQVNAWTAFYVGYNSDYRNRELVPDPGPPRIEPTGGRLENDARQLFVKLSWLVRF